MFLLHLGVRSVKVKAGTPTQYLHPPDQITVRAQSMSMKIFTQAFSPMGSLRTEKLMRLVCVKLFARLCGSWVLFFPWEGLAFSAFHTSGMAQA